MANLDKSQIIDLLNNIQSNPSTQVPLTPDLTSQRGREVDFNNLTIMRVFILMFLVKINTIKGIWKYLSQNPDISIACGFPRLPDRSTLSRRLHKLDIADWL